MQRIINWDSQGIFQAGRLLNSQVIGLIIFVTMEKEYSVHRWKDEGITK